MDEDDHTYRRAEQALLDSEGVAAETHYVDLGELGGRARVLISDSNSGSGSGSAGGPPMLFVPGVMTGGAVFAGLVGRLSDYRCILLDRPGTGLSPVLPGQSTDLADKERIADALLVDVLNGLDVDRAHLVSTSMGGWTAFRSAAAHPDRFLRIGALAFQVGAPVNRAPLSMRMPTPPAPMMPRGVRLPRVVVRAMLKSAGMRTAIETGRFSDELLDWIVALLRYTPTFRNDSRYTPRPVTHRGPNDAVRLAPELLAKVTAPVHLFWGADDVFGGAESARAFTEMLPDAQLQVVTGAGHAPWLDEPELAAAAIRAHFDPS